MPDPTRRYLPPSLAEWALTPLIGLPGWPRLPNLPEPAGYFPGRRLLALFDLSGHEPTGYKSR